MVNNVFFIRLKGKTSNNSNDGIGKWSDDKTNGDIYQGHPSFFELSRISLGRKQLKSDKYHGSNSYNGIGSQEVHLNGFEKITLYRNISTRFGTIFSTTHQEQIGRYDWFG
jgi:hypothetical protein